MCIYTRRRSTEDDNLFGPPLDLRCPILDNESGRPDGINSSGAASLTCVCARVRARIYIDTAIFSPLLASWDTRCDALLWLFYGCHLRLHGICFDFRSILTRVLGRAIAEMAYRVTEINARLWRKRRISYIHLSFYSNYRLTSNANGLYTFIKS